MKFMKHGLVKNQSHNTLHAIKEGVTDGWLRPLLSS